MAGRSAKYGGGSGSSSRSGSPPGYPPMPSISSYGSVYDGPGNIPLMGGGPPPPPPGPGRGAPPPPMIGVEGGPLVPSPYSGLDKQASRKVVNMPPYSSLNNKREAPAYEELINFPRAKDKDEMRCVMCGHPPSDSCVIPRQNKDVCKDCDKATWLHVASDVYFKWCKGCKKFLKLGSFSQKLDAAKCDKCRERGRQSYLQKKGKDADDFPPGLPHHRHHGPPPLGHPHFLPPPPGVGFPGMPPPPHIAGRGPPPGPFIGLPPPPPGMGLPGHRGGPRGAYRELEGEDLIGEGEGSGDEGEGPPPHFPPPPHIMHHAHGPPPPHPGLLGPPPSITAALGEDSASGSTPSGSVKGEHSHGGEGEEGEEDEGEEGADAMLSKLKSGGSARATPTPLLGGGEGGEGAAGLLQPGTPTGASTQAAPGGSPIPTTPGGTAIAPGATTLSALIGSEGATGNNLMELARIHQQIMDLEEKAQQVTELSEQLEQERRRNRQLEGTVERLSLDLQRAQHEVEQLRYQLDQWRAREEALQRHEGHEGHPMPPPPMAHAPPADPAAASANENDKRNRSDSVAGAAALLGGFKKQRVGTGGSGESLSVATGGPGSPTGSSGGGAAEGAAAEAAAAPAAEQQPAEGKEGGAAGSGGEGGVFGVGYETPRANAIKGAPIAL